MATLQTNVKIRKDPTRIIIEVEDEVAVAEVVVAVVVEATVVEATVVEVGTGHKILPMLILNLVPVIPVQRAKNMDIIRISALI